MAAFIKIEEIEHGVDSADGETGFCEPEVEAFGVGIAPAGFTEEGIPDFDFLHAGSTAVGEGPFEEFVVSATFQSLRFQGGVVDVQKTAAPAVKAPVKAFGHDPVGRKPAVAVQPDFIQHAAELNNAAYRVVRTAEAGDGSGLKGHRTVGIRKD